MKTSLIIHNYNKYFFFSRRHNLIALKEKSQKSRSPSLNNSPISIKSTRSKIINDIPETSSMEELEEEEEPIVEIQIKRIEPITTKKSVECLDTQVSSLHQDVATLSLEVRNAIHALQEMTYSTIGQLDLQNPARSIPNLPNNTVHAHVSEQFLTRSSSQPAEIWKREIHEDARSHHLKSVSDFAQSNQSFHISVTKATQTELSIDYEMLENLVLSNPQLVLNILGVKTHLPVNFINPDIAPMSCLSVLSTIPEAISSEPSSNNLHELTKDNSQDHPSSWSMYDNEHVNCKSTDALIEDTIEDDVETYFPPSISFTIVKENQFKSNSSLTKTADTVVEKSVGTRSRSASKNNPHTYEPTSSDSLTDSHGYVDDFDESCALITIENNKKRIFSSTDVVPKRNSLTITRVPGSYRHSAGDADKLEKGMKSISTQSLKDNS